MHISHPRIPDAAQHCVAGFSISDRVTHGVRGCAAGLRYVLYLYMTSLEDPTKVIAQPGGYFLAPWGGERIGDVSNVLFSNGWIADEDGKIFIYYASSDTRMHVAVSTVEILVDYCMNTPEDGLRSATSVAKINELIDKNKQYKMMCQKLKLRNVDL